ncbi:hypothetical protein BGZ65_005633 [Modicella reniformis]|uniref:Centrosomin N-terminal motif 1 domain-containing protein n=1 Tax=Modicella reniformis TaxID=1440133 RepID=A0A9P6MBD0_9FUNG|nr:hypothetical protein BGZ65_005633 [Modicella reniformis]
MENQKSTSPQQLLQMRYTPNGVDEDNDDDEGEISRLGLPLEAIDADIYLDESVRENPSLYAHSGYAGSINMNDLSGGPISRKSSTDPKSTSTGKTASMTLKEQEKLIDELKNECFQLKLKIYYLEDRLGKLSPENVEEMAKENADLKVQLQIKLSELRQLKKLLREAHAAIRELQAQKNCDLQHGMTDEQEEEFRNAIAERLGLRAKLKQLAQMIEALEREMNAKDSEILQLQSRLDELDMPAEIIEDLKAKYEDQIGDLQDQLLEYQQNGSHMFDNPKADESWRTRCQELEHELAASQEELLQARSEMTTMNHYLEQQRDELSRARIDVAKLSRQLDGGRDQLHHIEDNHVNEMDALSEQFNLDMDDLRKHNEQLQDQCQDLGAWRDEDAARHAQQLEDIVAELDDRTSELAQLQDHLRDAQDHLRDARAMLHTKNATISKLEDQIKQLQLEISRHDADAAHDEAIAMKSKQNSGSLASLRADTVPLHDFQLISKDLAQSEDRNRKLESKLRVATDQRIAAERLNAEASDQIAELTNDLSDHNDRLRYYEEQDSQLSREIEARLKLTSDLESTKAQVMELLQMVEKNKAAAMEKTDLLDSQSREMDRLNVKIRKLDDAAATLEEEKEQLETELRDRATTIAMLRSRLAELELSKKQQDEESSGETTRTRTDLVDRNSLLLTILQHLESILGGDSRLDSNMLPKPSGNFGYFSNHLLSRLKSLSGLFVLFERKAKELETETVDQLTRFKKQMNMKLRQLDDFENTVNNAAERQKKWREQLIKKQAENEELHARLALLTKANTDLKGRSQSNDRLQDYETHYRQAERKLQLEKTRYTNAEDLWNARMRELEKRTKDAEEKVKRERQGNKERVASLMDDKAATQKNNERLQLQIAYQQEVIDLSRNMEPSQGSRTHSESQPEQELLKFNQLRNKIEQLSRTVDREKEKTRSANQNLEEFKAHSSRLEQQLEQRDEAIKSTLGSIHVRMSRVVMIFSDAIATLARCDN